MLTKQQLTELLRENGYKVTPQRIAVYEALSAEAWHPSAEMLYNRLKPKFPAMSLATVYKTVEILQSMDIIQILSAGEDSFRYDADVSEHAHILCVKCGSVADIFLPNRDKALDEQLRNDVEEECGYKVEKHQSYFFGLCPKCRKLAEH